MEKRPWPIIVLAALHILEPVIKVLFYSLLWGMSVPKFFGLFATAQAVDVAIFWLPFPIAGLAIFAVKKWSLPLFVTVQLFTIARQWHDVANFPRQFPPLMIAGFVLMNVLVTTYFLLPAVRLAYLDPSVRWWEALPRYFVDWTVNVQVGKKAAKGRISNISRGGILCELSNKEKIEAGQELKVDFAHGDFAFELTGQVRHCRSDKTKTFFGVQFVNLEATQKRALREMTRGLERQGVNRKPSRENAFESFLQWGTQLVTTGEGLFPEVKRPQPKPRSHQKAA